MVLEFAQHSFKEFQGRKDRLIEILGFIYVNPLLPFMITKLFQTYF